MQSLGTLVSRLWWAILLRGVVAIVFGVTAFLWPGLTLVVLVTLFGVYAFVDGIAGIVLGLKHFGGGERWWGTLFASIVSLGAGIVTFVTPGITAAALLMLIAFWSIARGILEIVAAIRLRDVIQGEWLLALGGAMSIAFGILLLMFPGSGALALVWWIAAYAVVLGVVLVGLGLRMRSLAHAF